VDLLVPDMEDDVVDVNMVQRMTDSGRRVRFRVTAVVGNRNGLVGLGQAKGREVGPTIRRAIDDAKLHLTQLRRGCGSWECGCFTPHTVPFTVTGKAASVRVTLRPAPRGMGVAAGDVAKQVLGMAGIRDVWAYTEGQTRTTINFAKAAFDALRETSRVRVTDGRRDALKIIEGPVFQSAPPAGPGPEQAAAAPEGSP
ncbi:MAG: 30S ribosomal protein S5, partial [bacterium]